MRTRLIRSLALAFVLAPALAFPQPASVLADAERLIRAGRAAEAWRLLGPHEAALAGQPLYDYLYGVAALDAGQPREAIRALERVVANDPGAASARLELGRAYYEAGERGAAERQFRAALESRPTAGAGDAARSYLNAIRPPSSAAPGGLRAGYDFGGGYDSNANASTSDTTFMGVTLDPANVERESAFLTLGGWFAHAGELGGGRVETQGRLGHRWNPDAEFVDQTLAALGTTLSFGDGPTVFAVGLGGWYGMLDGDPHHWSASLDLSLGRRFGDGWRATGMLRAGQLRYEESDFPGLSILDMDQYLGALALQRAGDGGHFGVTVFAATDEEQESLSPFGNDRLGVQVYGGKRNPSGNDIGLQFAWQDIDYDDTPGFFGGQGRADTHWSAAFTVQFHDWLVRGLTLAPRVGFTVNSSNIALYDYDRFEAGLTLTRSFR